MVERISQAQQPPSKLRETSEVIVRGTVYTIRKDVRYDRSVPKSATIGFGHLGAYPAQITIEEIAIPKSQ